MNSPAAVAPDSGDSGQDDKSIPAGESLVNACTATDCRYNKALTCGAGAVTITVLSGKPVCATFSPRITL